MIAARLFLILLLGVVVSGNTDLNQRRLEGMGAGNATPTAAPGMDDGTGNGPGDANKTASPRPDDEPTMKPANTASSAVSLKLSAVFLIPVVVHFLF